MLWIFYLHESPLWKIHKSFARPFQHSGSQLQTGSVTSKKAACVGTMTLLAPVSDKRYGLPSVYPPTLFTFKMEKVLI